MILILSSDITIYSLEILCLPSLENMNKTFQETKNGIISLNWVRKIDCTTITSALPIENTPTLLSRLIKWDIVKTGTRLQWRSQ